MPFVIDGGFNSSQQATIRAAIKIWNDNTIIRLIPRGRHKDRIVFRPATSGCQSKLGRQGGAQDISCNLSGGFGTGSIVHEIGHAVGLIHEHKRRDRDSNVTVQSGNLKRDKFTQAQFRIDRDGRSYGEYDHESIMHYGRTSTNFSIDPANDIITPPPGITLGNSTLSPEDIRTIELLYGRKRGNLLWYNHKGLTSGSADFDFDYGKRVGTGWNRFTDIFAGQNSSNTMYGVERNGDLKWYRHLGAANGQASWRFDTGRKVGSGWNRFRRIVATNQGVIYGIEPNGDLKWYRHEGVRTGAATWTNDTGVKVGSGWNRFRHVFASSSGVLYAIERNGDLKWYRHNGMRDGTVDWHPASGGRVGTGWQRFAKVIASGSTIYAVEGNGDLMWYRHRGFSTGAGTWQFNTGRKIGTGWDIYRTLISTGNGRLYGVIR